MAVSRDPHPEDFGLIAMATVVIGFPSVFRTWGSDGNGQKAKYALQVSTLFWLNVGASVISPSLRRRPLRSSHGSTGPATAVRARDDGSDQTTSRYSTRRS
jgi:hypothetical protein